MPAMVTQANQVTAPRPMTAQERDTKRNHKACVNRPWTAYDGEGVTLPDGSHKYIQFSAMSQTDGIAHSIEDANGLSPNRIYWHIIQMMTQYPGNINIIYGGSYDFNMWLNGSGTQEMSPETLDRIYHGHYTKVGRYRIRWTRGKAFYVGLPDYKIGGTIYDVVSFFQTTFVNACDAYLGNRFESRDLIIEQKQNRGSFKTENMDEIVEYNSAELRNLIALMDELRERLAAVGMFPKRWDGPGAVAAYLLGREGIKAARATCPEPVAKAARYAYAGGRFEVVKFGHYDAPCYEYDVNSAYPSALLDVPNLAEGTWSHTVPNTTNNNGKQLPTFQTFSLIHVSAKTPRDDIPAPLFRRCYDGTVVYPQSVTGWYWSPEYEALKLYADTVPGTTIHVIEAWEFYPHPNTPKPFAFVLDLYEQRKMLKRAGNGAHVGIKLALNSLYGKLAQQIGWKIDDNGAIKIPPFHQIEWAGYVTSWCRAQVLQAALTNIESVIAFETDALFTTEPLNVTIGANLGQFEATTFDNLTYLQSGTYFGDIEGQPVTAKTRGIDRGKLSRDECHALLAEPDAAKRRVPVTLTRFNTAGLALMRGLTVWCRWEQMTKNVTVEPTGKRVHSPYCHCQQPSHVGQGITPGWHRTLCPLVGWAHSAQFPVEWINRDDSMADLSALRDNVTDWSTDLFDFS